jgi:alpha-D-xyloside xylohydrolase
MKFTDGYWMMRPGVTASYATQAYDVKVGQGTLVVDATTRVIRTRGDTLNGTVLTVRLSSPMPGVVGVEITHHAGGVPTGPQFAVAAQEGWQPEAYQHGDTAVLRAGDLEAHVHVGESWQVSFRAGGREITSSGWRSTAAVVDADGRRFVHERLTLGVGTHVYGLGERFGPLVRNGQAVDMWNADGGTSSEQAYKNVPFFLTDAGYGVFVDHPGRVSYEVGSEVVSRVQMSVEGQSMRYYVIHGPTPKEVLRRYAALTGRPALPPAWSFGPWLSTSFTTSYDEETVTTFVDGMAERGLPVSVFHFDCFWMREHRWCDFEWDRRVFPDPEGMLARLHERGLRVSVWINPYIAQRSPLFAEGAARGYLVRRPDGPVWQWDRWQPGMALVDFTNPDARAWYTGYLRRLLDMGVDCFKTDFGERVPTDVVWHDGSDPERMHNYYTHLYNQTVFDLLREHRGEGEAVLFARSATAGGQRFPVHWGGDCESTFVSMAESLRGGLSLGLSGFGFWSHDIGGFEGTPDPAVFKRWVPFGLLSSHSRFHGSDSYRVPWAFDEEAVDVVRTFGRLKARLMPYLWAGAHQATDDGVPVMRAMLLEFPDDPGAATVETQYMLGGSLLVAPVMSEHGEVAYYLPEGRWTHLLSGDLVEGPRWVREKHGFDSLPLLVREGAVLPLGSPDARPEDDHRDGVTLEVYEPVEGSRQRVVVPGPLGEPPAVFEVGRTGSVVRATSDSRLPWRLAVVRGRERVEASADGAGTLELVLTDPRGGGR